MPGRVRPLELIIRGVNRVRGPIREANQQIESMTGPVRKVQNAFRGLGRDLKLPALKASVKGVATEIGALANTAFYGAAGIFAMAAGMRHFIDTGDGIAAIATKLGTTTDAVQELRYAAGQLNVDSGELDRSMETFQKNIVDTARGAGRAQFAFKALGVQVRDARGIRDTSRVFDEFMGKLADIQDPALRARIALAAFGNVDMVQMAVNAETMAKLRKEAHELGGVIDAETIRKTAEADDELNKLGVAARGFAYTIAAELIPTVIEVSQAIRAWLKENRHVIRETIVPAIQTVVLMLRMLVPIILKVVQSTAGMAAIFAYVTTSIFGPLILSIAKFGSALWDVARLVIPVVADGIALLSKSILSLAMRVLPLLVNALRAVGMAAAANPIGAIVLAVAALAALAVYLYRNWKPFHDLVDRTWSKIEKFGAKAGKWLGFGPVEEPSASAAVAPGGGSARDFAPGPQRLNGRIGIDVGVQRGATANVRALELTPSSVRMDTGMILAPGT